MWVTKRHSEGGEDATDAQQDDVYSGQQNLDILFAGKAKKRGKNNINHEKILSCFATNRQTTTDYFNLFLN